MATAPHHTTDVDTGQHADRLARGRVRDLFLRVLGGIFVAAFLSLAVQMPILVGDQGLLPARELLAHAPSFLDAPTLFRWLPPTDGALDLTAIAGACFGLGLLLGVAPRWCLAAAWALYLSLVTVGQDFLSFQWDNLLLESAAMALFVAPGGLRPRRAPAPHPFAVFLMLWLLFRLHVESGLAKLLLGDPGWRDLTAMASYYETAPLPTWIAWYVHQMPLGAHRASGAFMYVVELGIPFLVFATARLRALAFACMIAMQVTIGLTANYGIFNYLSAALALFALDDAQLARAASRMGVTLAPAAPARRGTVRGAFFVSVAGAVVALSAIQFLPFVTHSAAVHREIAPVQRRLNAFRSINAYHLFAQMTYVRREAVIEGSADGVTWLPYELRYKPGDPARRPPFVAPHQPRLDFQLWFLLLHGQGTPLYFGRLLERLLTVPRAMAPLFARDPFPETPPQLVRVAVYRYRFTRFGTAAWWERELQGYRGPYRAPRREEGR